MGARRLPLATVGRVQYLSPTIQLALGVWVFHEPFDRARLLREAEARLLAHHAGAAEQLDVRFARAGADGRR